MASSPETAATRSAAPETTARGDEAPTGHVVREGHLPVSEFLFDKPGAGSPYGDEIEFPLPADRLPYRHPQSAAPRER
jgi:hypothetical protein